MGQYPEQHGQRVDDRRSEHHQHRDVDIDDDDPRTDPNELVSVWGRVAMDHHGTLGPGFGFLGNPSDPCSI
jgi:hypothetical protein